MQHETLNDLTPEYIAEIRNKLGDLQAYKAQREAMRQARIVATQPPRAAPSLIETSFDFLAGFTPPDYCIDGILQNRFCYSLTASTGSGKTAVALLMAASKALGRPIGGREVDPGRVLYLAGENADDVRMRWMVLAEAMDFSPADIEVHFLAGTCEVSKSTVQIAQEVAGIGGVSMVIVDTSAAYNEALDENDNVAAGKHARLMRELTALPGGPCVLVLCHPAKNAQNLLPRGGGAFIAEVDGNLTCTKDDDIVTLHWEGKFRGPDFAPILFKLEQATSKWLKDTKGRLIPSVMAKVISEKEQEKAEVEATAEMNAAAICLMGCSLSFRALGDAMGISKASAQRVVDKLKNFQLVESGLGGVTLTAKGKKYAEGLSK